MADSIEVAWRQLVEQFSTERRQQVLRDFTPQWFFGLMSPVVVAHLREVRKAFARRKIMQEVGALVVGYKNNFVLARHPYGWTIRGRGRNS